MGKKVILTQLKNDITILNVLQMINFKMLTKKSYKSNTFLLMIKVLQRLWNFLLGYIMDNRRL